MGDLNLAETNTMPLSRPHVETVIAVRSPTYTLFNSLNYS